MPLRNQKHTCGCGVWEGEGVSMAEEELRCPHPLSQFGSGVGWQLCSRRHPSHLEGCKQKDERNQTLLWSQSSPAVAEPLHTPS